MVLVVCPACGEAQARAAEVEGDAYACRACHRRFTKAEGIAIAKAREEQSTKK